MRIIERASETAEVEMITEVSCKCAGPLLRAEPLNPWNGWTSGLRTLPSLLYVLSPSGVNIYGYWCHCGHMVVARARLQLVNARVPPYFYQRL